MVKVKAKVELQFKTEFEKMNVLFKEKVTSETRKGFDLTFDKVKSNVKFTPKTKEVLYSR